MLRWILIVFFGWLLYKLVFNIIVPGYRLTQKVKRQMSDMQEGMRQQYEAQQAPQQAPPAQRPAEKPRKDDYLDFEEIK
ncbi:hypothetical protein [Chitinophaga sp. MM2321]|uniref:hypothetical protein n=1 Tax=Chitinophaga sp. MM2321 TaxID=3137178 RepID=UPI0032D59FC1